MLPKKKPNFKQ